VSVKLNRADWTEAGDSTTFCNDDPALAVQQMTDLMTANPGLSATLPGGGWPLFTRGAFGALNEVHKQLLDGGAFSVVSADTLPVEPRKAQDGEVGGRDEATEADVSTFIEP